MGHFGQVGYRRLSIYCLPQCDGQIASGCREFGRFEYLAQIYLFTFTIRYFDADHGFTGHWSLNSYRRRLQCQRQVVGKVDDLANLNSRSRLELVHSNHRARLDLDHAPHYAEVGELLFEHPGASLQSIPVNAVFPNRWFIEKT